MPVSSRHAAARYAEAGDHFVENQQCAVGARDGAQLFEIFATLEQQAVIRGRGLDDYGGDARAFAAEEIVQRFVIVERQHSSAFDERGWHAGRGRLAEGGEARACGNQKVIGVAVIAAPRISTMRSRPVKARARRMALITASVPDDTNRTCSSAG